jgi:hypothetical protein
MSRLHNSSLTNSTFDQATSWCDGGVLSTNSNQVHLPTHVLCLCKERSCPAGNLAYWTLVSEEGPVTKQLQNIIHLLLSHAVAGEGSIALPIELKWAARYWSHTDGVRIVPTIKDAMTSPREEKIECGVSLGNVGDSRMRRYNLSKGARPMIKGERRKKSIFVKWWWLLPNKTTLLYGHLHPLGRWCKHERQGISWTASHLSRVTGLSYLQPKSWKMKTREPFAARCRSRFAGRKKSTTILKDNLIHYLRTDTLSTLGTSSRRYPMDLLKMQLPFLIKFWFCRSSYSN